MDVGFILHVLVSIVCRSERDGFDLSEEERGFIIAIYDLVSKTRSDRMLLTLAKQAFIHAMTKKLLECRQAFDNTQLSIEQINALKLILKQRDLATRSGLHYFKKPSDWLNLFYIKLTFELAEQLNEPFLGLLVQLENTMDYNRGAHDDKADLMHCKVYNRYNYFVNDVSRDGVLIKKRSPSNELFTKGLTRRYSFVVPRASFDDSMAVYSNHHNSVDFIRKPDFLDDHHASLARPYPQLHHCLPPELHGLYFFNNTVFSIGGLFEINNVLGANDVPFSTYMTPLRKKRRALFPKEFLAIADKSEQFELVDSLSVQVPLEHTTDQCMRYNKPWDLLHDRAIPHWANRGLYRKNLVFELIITYLRTKPSEFELGFDHWSKKLQTIPIEDANCLYGQIVSSNPSNTCYFIDVLNALIQDYCAYNANSMMFYVVRWYVASHGIQDLADEYVSHWREIKDTPADYLRDENNASSLYVVLAKKLAEKGLIQSNYFRFIIPTLTHDIESVSQDPISTLKLHHFVLSENETSLIYLPASLEYCRTSRGLFLNLSCSPISSFHPSEISRLRANQRFKQFAAYADQTKIAVKSLHRETVSCITEFVRKYIVDLASKTSVDFDTLELEKNQLFEHFCIWYGGLAHHEQQCLEQQIITRLTYHLTFKQWFYEIKRSPEAVCLKTTFTELMSIVVRYNPYQRFAHDIESLVDVKSQKMSLMNRYRLECVPRLIYRDYMDLSTKELSRRLVIILMNVFSLRFEDQSETIELCGVLTNKVPKPCADAVQRIKVCFANKPLDHDEMADAYSEVMLRHIEQHSTLTSGLFNLSIFNQLTLATTTHEWAKSVINGSLFAKNNAIASPSDLHEKLDKLAYRSPLYAHVVKIMDDLRLCMNSAFYTLPQVLHLNLALQRQLSNDEWCCLMMGRVLRATAVVSYC